MNRRKFIVNSTLTGFSLLFPNIIYSNTNIFDKIIIDAKKLKWYKLPINELIIKVAKNFVGVPYEAHTLEINENEQCVVNLNGLDCVTFYENSLCIARIIKKQLYTFNDLIKEVTFTRYRDGILIDYTSRLHYTSDWINNNIQKKVIKVIGEKYNFPSFKPNVYYMSKNPNKYKQLANNTKFIEEIKKIENEINKLNLYYIPKDNISEYMKYIYNGDILALRTNIEGLDYSHTGLAFKVKDTVRLFHASTKTGNVLIDVNIEEYLKNKKRDVGITVIRALEP
jgi:hypothetical protein